MRKLFVAAIAGALLLSFGGATSAFASTGGEPAEPKASTWLITAVKFGPHHLGESVATASKLSHIDYHATLRKALGAGVKKRCPQPVRLPLLAKGVNKRNVWGLATLPCDTTKRSLAAYEAHYKPYAKAVLDTFVTSANEWDGAYAPHYAYGKYLPHAKAAVGDTYATVAAAYGPKGYLDQGYTDQFGNTNGTYVVAGKLGARITELRLRIESDSVATISLTRFPAGY